MAIGVGSSITMASWVGVGVGFSFSASGVDVSSGVDVGKGGISEVGAGFSITSDVGVSVGVAVGVAAGVGEGAGPAQATSSNALKAKIESERGTVGIAAIIESNGI